MADFHLPQPLVALGDALAQLPLESPATSAWPVLSAHIRHSRAQSQPPLASRLRTLRAWRLPAALAAGLLALALMPRGISDAPVAAPASSNAIAAKTGSLQQLMAESGRLENLISASDTGTSSASAAVLGLELDDRLQNLDALLAARNLSAADRLSLWQQRVAALRDYAGFETTRRWYAAEGRNLDVTLVAAY